MTIPYYSPEETLEQRVTRQRKDYERLIRWYFPPEEHAFAIYLCWQLSGMSVLAFHRNGHPGIGLFGIDPNKVGIKPEDAWRLHLPIVNIAAAHKLWSEHGWRAWSFEPLETAFADKEELLKE